MLNLFKLEKDTNIESIKYMIKFLEEREKNDNWEITEICSEFAYFLDNLNNKIIDKISKEYVKDVYEDDRSYLDFFYYISNKLDSI